MRRLKKIILLLPAVVIIVIGVIVLGRLGPPPEQIRLIAQSELSRQLGRPVSIGRVSRGILTRAVLHDVRVDPPQGERGKPLLFAPTVTATYRLGDVLAGRTDAVASIGRIVVDRPQVVVERSAQGVWSIADLITRPRLAEPSKFRGRVVVRNGHLTLTDRAAGRGVTTFEVERLHADVDWGRPRQVAIAVSGQSADGRFRRLRALGGYDAESRTFQGSLNAAAVTAATLDGYLPRAAPVRLTSGALDGQLLAVVPMDGGADWSAKITLDRVGVRAPILGQQAVISGRTRVVDNVLHLDDVRAEAKAARLRVTGTVAGLANPQLDLTVQASSDQPALVIRTAAGANLDEWLTLEGPLTARLRVLGPAAKPAAAGRVSLAGVTVRGLRAQLPSADVSYREGQVWVENLRAQVAGGQVTGKAWIAPGEQGVNAVVRAELTGVRAEEITHALRTEPVSGRLSGEVAVEVARGRPDAIAKLTLVAGSVRGVPFNRGQVLARWADGALSVSEAAVESPHGRLHANGTVSRKELELAVSLSDLDLAVAGLAFGRGDLGGTASAQGTLTGPPSSPKFEGTVVASEVRMAGYRAEALEAQVAASREEVEVTAASVYCAAGRIGASGKIVGPDFARGQISARLRMRSADLAQWYVPQGDWPRLGGVLHAMLEVEGRLPQPQASGTAEVTALEVEGMGLGSARAEIGYADGTVTVSRGGLTINGSEVRLRGTVATRPAPGEVNLTVTADNFDLSSLSIERLSRAGVELGGRISLDARVTGSPQRLAVSGSIADSQLAVDGVRLRNLAAAGTWSGGRAELERVQFNLGKGTYSARGTAYAPDGALDLAFDVRDADLTPLRAASRALEPLGGALRRAAQVVAGLPMPLSGALNAQGRIAGKPQARRGSVTFQADHLMIGSKPVPALQGTVAFAGSRLTVERFVAKAEEAYATVQGTIDWDGEMNLDVDAYNISAQTIRSVARVKAPLSGTASVSMLVTGSTRSPRVVATIAASDARIGPVALGEVLVSRLEISEQAITLEKLALAPDGRPLSVSGKVAFSWTAPHLPPDGPLEVSVDLGQQDLDLLAALLPDLVRDAEGSVSGALHLGGTWARPQYDGRVRVEKGTLALGDFAETDLDASLLLTTQQGEHPRPVLSGRIAVRPVFGVPSVAIAPAGAMRLPDVLNPRLDLRVVIEDDSRLETPAVGMWLTGEGHIGGTVSAPTVNVSTESRRGFLQLPASRLRLTYAAVDLVRPAPAAEEPAPRLRLFLNADYEGEATRYEEGGLGRSYSITMRLSGDLLDPERPLDVELRSVPDLPEAEVYALVTGVGAFLGAFREGTLSALAGSQARDLFTAGYAATQLQPVERRIADALGLEEFGIDLSTLTIGRPLRLRIGKALSKRLYVTYSRAVSGRQADQMRLFLELTPTWSLGAMYEPEPLDPATLSQQPASWRVDLRKTLRF